MDIFCKFCGTKHAEPSYPKQCVNCDNITWINPLPVAVLLQPVRDGPRIGILIGERGIEPMKGSYGLPGGYIDCSDKDIISAARREFLEEIGFEAPPADQMQLFSSYSDGRCMLTFVKSFLAISLDDLERFVPNDECPAIRVAWEPERLCFNSHTEALAKYFK